MASFNIFGNTVTVKLSAEASQGAMSLLHDVTPPLGGPPLHRHKAEAESFYVLQGEFLFEIDGKEIHAGAGDTVSIPVGAAHLYQNVGNEPGEMLIITAPGGIDRFFAELHDLLSLPGEPNFPAIAQLHAKYGMELLGPPRSARG